MVNTHFRIEQIRLFLPGFVAEKISTTSQGWITSYKNAEDHKINDQLLAGITAPYYLNSIPRSQVFYSREVWKKENNRRKRRRRCWRNSMSQSWAYVTDLGWTLKVVWWKAIIRYETHRNINDGSQINWFVTLDLLFHLWYHLSRWENPI